MRAWLPSPRRFDFPGGPWLERTHQRLVRSRRGLAGAPSTLRIATAELLLSRAPKSSMVQLAAREADQEHEAIGDVGQVNAESNQPAGDGRIVPGGQCGYGE